MTEIMDQRSRSTMRILMYAVFIGFGLKAEAFRPPRGSRGLEEHTRTGFACEGSTLSIDCVGHTKKIFVVRANYGRQNPGICNEGGDVEGWNLQCMSTRAPKVVARICNGTRNCSVTASNVHFEGDPCPGTLKYLEIEYYCLPEGLYPLDPTPGVPEPTTTTTTTTTVAPPPTTVVASTTTTITSTTTTESMTATPLILTAKPTKPTPKPTPKISTTKIYTKPTKPTPPSIKHTTTERMQGEPGHQKHFCDEEIVRGVTWPRTRKGAWALMACPNNEKVRRALWRCGRNPVDWLGKPDLSGCKSQELMDLGDKLAKAKEEFSTDIITEVASNLERSSESSVLFGGDIKEMSKIMRTMVKQVDTQSKNISKPVSKQLIENVTKSILTTSSNILSEEKEDSWTDLPQATQAETATRVVSAVEESAYQMADTYETPSVTVNITLNIILEVDVIDTRGDHTEDLVFPRTVGNQKPEDTTWLGSGNSIRLSGQTLKDLSSDGLAKLIFLTYNNLERWLRPQARVPAATAYGDYGNTYEEFRRRENEVYDPYAFEFQPSDPHMNANPSINDGPQPKNSREEEVDRLPNQGQGDQGQSQGDKKPASAAEENEVGQDADVIDLTTPGFVFTPPMEEKPPNSTKVVNSQIISASVLQKGKDANGTETKKSGHIPLSEPVLYTLEHKTASNVYNPSCSFWEYSEKSFTGKWSTFGCNMIETNLTHTTCSCNHMTNFAVLMDVKGVELTEEHEFALAFITYLGCIISIVCLVFCFITFTVFKNLQSDRNTIHKNLVICLFVAEVLFLAGIMQHAKQVLCSVMAGFLHYFFLAAFMWMLMEGIQLYVMLVEVFEAEKSRVKYYYLVSYGTPAVIVGISAAVNHMGYGTDSHCWLSTEGGFIWAFVGPVVAIITVNIVMLSIAIYQMCKHADAVASWKMKQKSKMENVRSWIKGASVLVVLLGLTWTFGLLYINQHTLFMAYIFTALNSLQGLFIFIFHCVMNEKVQKEYKRCVRRATWLPETLRVKYGGAKLHASTSPNQSTSSGNYLTKLLSGRRRKRSSTGTVRSSLSNPSRSGLYQNMKHDPARESAHISDSGIGRNPDSMYSENTEDNGGYLEPVSIRVNDHLLDELDAGVDFSMMEGSCVDTDYYGVDGTYKPQAALDVDKYKIKANNPNRLSAISNDRPISESDFSDGELLKMTDKEKTWNEYEQLIPQTKSELDLMDNLESDSYNTLLQKKLKQFAAESNSSIANECAAMNNLNKGDNEASRDSLNLSTPNIRCKSIDSKELLGPATKDESCQRSLPSLADSKPTEAVAIEKLKKALSSSDDGLITIATGGQKPQNRLSNDTNEALDVHRYRLTSSDC